MFDPTIYENLKVVAEGAIYDLDLIGQILVTDRVDQVDLAKLSRFYSVTFRIAAKGENSVHGALCIYVDVNDLASEIMDKADDSIGCNIEILFITQVHNIEKDCESINLVLQNVWGNRPSIKQQLSFIYDQDVNQIKNTVTLNFDRKIAEAQVGDIPIMVDHIVESIDRLNEILSTKL